MDSGKFVKLQPPNDDSDVTSKKNVTFYAVLFFLQKFIQSLPSYFLYNHLVSTRVSKSSYWKFVSEQVKYILKFKLLTPSFESGFLFQDLPILFQNSCNSPTCGIHFQEFRSTNPYSWENTHDYSSSVYLYEARFTYLHNSALNSKITFLPFASLFRIYNSRSEFKWAKKKGKKGQLEE